MTDKFPCVHVAFVWDLFCMIIIIGQITHISVKIAKRYLYLSVRITYYDQMLLKCQVREVIKKTFFGRVRKGPQYPLIVVNGDKSGVVPWLAPQNPLPASKQGCKCKDPSLFKCQAWT